MSIVEINLYHTSSSSNEGIVLYYKNAKETLLSMSERLLIGEIQKSYKREELIRDFEILLEFSPLTKHIEVVLEYSKLDEQRIIRELIDKYKRIKWTCIRVEKMNEIQKKYHFDFVYIAKKKEGFPFSTSLKECLEQEFKFEYDPISEFITLFRQVMVSCLKEDIDRSIKTLDNNAERENFFTNSKQMIRYDFLYSKSTESIKKVA